jgi:hypothetical protein
MAVPLRQRLEYPDAATLRVDVEHQFRHGGCYVRDATRCPPLHASVDLVIAVAGGPEVVLAASVVQVVPGAGYMVVFTDGAAVAGHAGLRALLDADDAEETTDVAGAAWPGHRDDSDGGEDDDDETTEVGGPPHGEAPLPEVLVADGEDEPQSRPGLARAPVRQLAEAGIAEVAALIHKMGQSEKLRLALTGNHKARRILAREANPTVHAYLLKNPRLTQPEVRELAASPRTGAASLKAIADSSVWLSDPEVPPALLNNPKTPLAVALRMADRVSRIELQRVVRLKRLRPPIVEACRTRLRLEG